MFTGRSRTWPALNENVNRACPNPAPTATKSYWPGTIRKVAPSAVAGSVSAIGVGPGLVVADVELTDWPLACPAGTNVTSASLANADSKLGTGSKSADPVVDAPEPNPRLANVFQSRS